MNNYRHTIKNLQKFALSASKTAMFVIVWSALFSCNQSANSGTGTQSCSEFTIQNFSPIANWQKDSIARKIIFIDYNNANSGFIIPSIKDVASGLFSFEFEIKNNSATSQNLYYKIYYQNESYKFEEFDSISKTENAYAEENFYGSWENTSIGFKKIVVNADNSFHKIEDGFRIIGNPRNEERYFHNGEDNRWKRNPRMGNYSFLLVIATENDLKNIPEYIQNINKKNLTTGQAGKEQFASPYYFFKYGEGDSLKQTISSVSQIGRAHV